jgi:rod shape-determining protein MreC
MKDLFSFLYRARILLLFLLLMYVSLTLLVNGNAHHRSQAISSSNAVVGTVYAWRNDVAAYARLKDVNRKLAKENASWRDKAGRLHTPDSARQVLDSTRLQQYRALHARVVNSTVNKQKNYLTLDRGYLRGLRPDMGVVGPEGVVGVVRDVSAHYASVVSVLHADLRVSVVLKRTGHFGLMAWDTNNPRTVSVLDIAKHALVLLGDTLVTRGGDGLFPTGTTVGIVETVEDPPGSNYHDITVRLSEDLTRSGWVYVVDDLMRMERDSLQSLNETP